MKPIGRLFGESELRAELEKEVAKAQADFLENATPENFLLLKGRWEQAKSLYDRAKTAFLSANSAKGTVELS